MSAAIEAVGLVKRFGRTVALDGLDLVAETGRVTAVLGPNGAGKTTLVRMVATLLRPDGGMLRVAGIDVARHPAQVRRVIGLAGQYAAVEGAMTGRENLEMVARLFGQRRRAARASAAAVLDQLGLTEVADRLVRTYSGGLRRRLDLGASLAGTPRLLLLDEPTAGLDPGSRIGLWDAVRSLAARGTDVLLTTQYLEEADRLAGQVIIINHGRVIAAGRPAELKARAGLDVIEVRVADRESLGRASRALGKLGPDEVRADSAALQVSVAVQAGPQRLTDAVQMLADAGAAVDDIALRRPTLDEVFLSLTGGNAP